MCGKKVASIDKSAIARLTWFFSDKTSHSTASSADDYNIPSALGNNLVPTSALEDVNNSMNAWKLHVISQFTSENFYQS